MLGLGEDGLVRTRCEVWSYCSGNGMARVDERRLSVRSGDGGDRKTTSAEGPSFTARFKVIVAAVVLSQRPNSPTPAMSARRTIVVVKVSHMVGEGKGRQLDLMV